MGEKQCGKCGEMVDEAKAFCPACGNAFVEEKKRTSVSNFDLSDKTVQLGDTMYNQMLSDMGLSISKTPSRQENVPNRAEKAPNRQEKRIESIAPAVPASPAKTPSPAAQPQAQKPSRLKWILIGVAGAALLLAMLVILVAVAIILYFR